MLGETRERFESTIAELMSQMPDGMNLSTMITEEKADEMYALGYSLYNDQLYTDASLYFRLLMLYNPRDPKFWKGLGACSQMKKDYHHALNCYICTQMLNNGQPDPHLYIHAADCYFAIDQKDMGLKALEAAHHCALEQQDQQLINHVALMKTLWCNK